jgi:hypothetical protein
MPSKNLPQMLAIRAAYGRAKEEGKDTSKLHEWIDADKQKFGKKTIGAFISKRLKETK